MALRSWRERLWFGLAVFIGVSVAMLVGPTYLQPLPAWMKVLVGIACGVVIATIAVYSRRRARRTSSP